MPSNAQVFLHYGPYEACGLVDHRVARLKGLQAVLANDGHSVETKQIDDWNVVKLWVNGEMVFTCNIKELDYGGDGELDPLCQQALKLVQSAF